MITATITRSRNLRDTSKDLDAIKSVPAERKQ